MAPENVKVLFLGSNPAQTQPLALDQEIKAIRRMIRASEHRDVLRLSSRWAVEPDDLLQALNEERPTIVHFSGHGSQAGEIILMDASGAQRPVRAGTLEAPLTRDARQAALGAQKPAGAQALKALFTALKDNIRLVVLNACYSRVQAEAIAEVIDCVVGMSDAISDRAAIAFAASFYRALGFGRSVQEAFEQGKVSLGLEGIGEETIPHLLERDGIDAASVVLVDTTRDEVGPAGRSSRTPLDPAKVIDVQTEFFNRLTKALWKWRYMAIQVAFYGRQEDRDKFASVAHSYDEGVWRVFPEMRIEISRAQRYLSYDTCLQLQALYAFIVEFDNLLSGLISRPEADPGLHARQGSLFSLLNEYIYAQVTKRIEDAIASVAAELRLGSDE